MKRRVLLSAILVLAPPFAGAQPEKVHTIGYMSLQSRASEAGRLAMFRRGMKDLGYVEGKNLIIEIRHAEGNLKRLAEFPAEFVRRKVDVIVAVGGDSIQVAQRATRTIPIIFPLTGDPTVFVKNLARPEGNVTGFTSRGTDLSRKRLEILREALPGLLRVAVVWNPANPTSALSMRELDVAAGALGLRVQRVEVSKPEDFEHAFSRMGQHRPQALYFVPDEMFHTRRARIAELAIKSRFPTMFYAGEWVEDGGLMAYASHVPDLFRGAAVYVDRILKGAKPGDLPVQQASKFELVVNLKTAQAIGIAIPRSILLRADRVIE